MLSHRQRRYLTGNEQCYPIYDNAIPPTTTLPPDNDAIPPTTNNATPPMTTLYHRQQHSLTERHYPTGDKRRYPIYDNALSGQQYYPTGDEQRYPTYDNAPSLTTMLSHRR